MDLFDYMNQKNKENERQEYADIYTILDKMVSKELEDYEKEYILYEIMRKLKNMTKDSFESLDFFAISFIDVPVYPKSLNNSVALWISFIAVSDVGSFTFIKTSLLYF